MFANVNDEKVKMVSVMENDIFLYRTIIELKDVTLRVNALHHLTLLLTSVEVLRGLACANSRTSICLANASSINTARTVAQETASRLSRSLQRAGIGCWSPSFDEACHRIKLSHSLPCICVCALTCAYEVLIGLFPTDFTSASNRRAYMMMVKFYGSLSLQTDLNGDMEEVGYPQCADDSMYFDWILSVTATYGDT